MNRIQGGAEKLPPESRFALSVKQPWAALLVAGVKTIEVRTWPTARRGRILIHASRIPDDRPEGWALVATPELRALADLRGGVIGVAELSECRTYTTLAAFAAECEQHRNAPDWFVPPRLFGFVFRDPRPIEYHACRGKTMFFRVGSGERPA
jgi:hypothetical protein